MSALEKYDATARDATNNYCVVLLELRRYRYDVANSEILSLQFRNPSFPFWDHVRYNWELRLVQLYIGNGTPGLWPSCPIVQGTLRMVSYCFVSFDYWSHWLTSHQGRSRVLVQELSFHLVAASRPGFSGEPAIEKACSPMLENMQFNERQMLDCTPWWGTFEIRILIRCLNLFRQVQQSICQGQRYY